MYGAVLYVSPRLDLSVWLVVTSYSGPTSPMFVAGQKRTAMPPTGACTAFRLCTALTACK